MRYQESGCNRQLEILDQCCSSLETAQGAGRWQGFKHALESTRRIISDLHGGMSRYAHLINLPERARWLQGEFDLALGQSDRTKQLLEFRRCFEETRDGVVRLWQERTTEAHRINRVGTFRKEAREIRSLLRHLENNERYSAAPTDAGGYHRWIQTVHRGQLILRYSLDEAIKATGSGEQLRTNLDALENLVYAYNKLFCRWGGCKKEFGTFLATAGKMLDQLEQESRLVFSKELDLDLLRDRQLGVSIREETGTPDQSVVRALRRMMREWLVDYNRETPQRGFGRVYSKKEVQDFCQKHGGRLFLVDMEGKTVGFYLIFVDKNTFPEHVTQALGEMEKAGEHMHSITGWAEVVGITHTGRDVAKARNLDLYSLMTEAVKDTFASFQIEKVFGEVREGAYANLSKANHLKRGWEETGVFVTQGPRRLPYQIIRMVLSPGGMW